MGIWKMYYEEKFKRYLEEETEGDTRLEDEVNMVAGRTDN